MLRFVTLSLACLGVIVICGQATPLLAAEQKVLAQTKGEGGNRWVWKGLESKGEDNPLVVEVKVGDEIEMEIVDGLHGFVTLNKEGDDEPNIDLDLVITCRDPASKPNAVLREVGPCIDGKSRLNDQKSGGPREMIRLIVLKKFTNDVFFWCAQHEEIMWGKLVLEN